MIRRNCRSDTFRNMLNDIRHLRSRIVDAESAMLGSTDSNELRPDMYLELEHCKVLAREYLSGIRHLNASEVEDHSSVWINWNKWPVLTLVDFKRFDEVDPLVVRDS